MLSKNILKTDGEEEIFSIEKLENSLVRSGASSKTAREVAEKIITDPNFSNLKNTREIHQKAFSLLKKKFKPVAGRYNLKQAILRLGPSGFPFENFVARLLEAKGYWTKVGKIMQGMCVDHEIDILAKKDDRHFIFECKFHNSLSYKSDVQTALYVKARFDDIKARWEQIEKNSLQKEHLHKAWIVTNTEFTEQVRLYASCVGIELMSWRYPEGRSLAELIDKTGLHPITAITSLNNHQKNYLIEHNVILCNELENKVNTLKKAGIYGRKLEMILREAKAIYSLQESL